MQVQMLLNFKPIKLNILHQNTQELIGIQKKKKCKNQYELFKKYDQFNEKEYAELKKYCMKIKIDFMSTPFDLESAKFLNKYVSCFKISSSDITNYPLLKLISSFKKPVILSTGASNLKEITSAVKIFKNNELVLLHCILNYPTKRKISTWE